MPAATSPVGPTVVVDATAMGTVAAHSGVGTYSRNLLLALARRQDLDVVALVQRGIDLPAGLRPLRVRRRASRPRAEVIEHALRQPGELLARRPRGSVYHNPGFHAPLGVRGPWVQTLHDLIPLVLDYPDLAPLKARWARFGPRYRRADAVIAVSRHAADEGIRLLGLDGSRVHVAHHGVGGAFRPAPEWPAEPPYLLVVSEFSERKGFAEAFAVLDALADGGYPHRLIVAGKIHDTGRERLEALRRQARWPDRIDVRGFVDSLVELYQGASVFLMTSRYEGFGLPALEAMAAGAPVVAFANSAVAEVVRGGGVLVADGDVEAMTAAARLLIDNRAAAIEQREAGAARAAGFTWAASAAVHAEVYRAVVR